MSLEIIALIFSILILGSMIFFPLNDEFNILKKIRKYKNRNKRLVEIVGVKRFWEMVHFINKRQFVDLIKSGEISHAESTKIVDDVDMQEGKPFYGTYGAYENFIKEIISVEKVRFINKRLEEMIKYLNDDGVGENQFSSKREFITRELRDLLDVLSETSEEYYIRAFRCKKIQITRNRKIKKIKRYINSK